MCPPNKPCNTYSPDWNAWDRSGNLCTGFGASPPCKNCGRKELHHKRDFCTEGTSHLGLQTWAANNDLGGGAP